MSEIRFFRDGAKERAYDRMLSSAGHADAWAHHRANDDMDIIVADNGGGLACAVKVISKEGVEEFPVDTPEEIAKAIEEYPCGAVKFMVGTTEVGYRHWLDHEGALLVDPLIAEMLPGDWQHHILTTYMQWLGAHMEVTVKMVGARAEALVIETVNTSAKMGALYQAILDDYAGRNPTEPILPCWMTDGEV